MNERYIQILGVLLSIAGFAFIIFLYWSEPRTFDEVTTKGQVVLGTYHINKIEFDQGLADFKNDRFPDARAAFERADPEKRDPATPFHVAYSYYRQGCGLVPSDDWLVEPG